jgi:hypothetical protein
VANVERFVWTTNRTDIADVFLLISAFFLASRSQAKAAAVKNKGRKNRKNFA